MSDAVKCDVAILGGGPGGYAAALRAALRGASVCCIEKGLVGGTCLNLGCIPAKAMLHASGMAHELSEMASFGIHPGELSVDPAALMGRIAKVVGGLRKGVEGLLKARKVAVIRGRGRLAGPGCIEVDTDRGPIRVEAGSVILATGASPIRPDFPPWDCGRIWTTDEATTADDLPESVIIVGGGVIGCEFATIYGELGIPTTVVEMLDHLAGSPDPDVSRAVTRSLTQRGVKVLTGSRVASVKWTGREVAAELADGSSCAAAGMLVCVGRKPDVQGLGLEALGVAMSEGVVAVDDRCRTSVDGLYAVGDVAENRQYAHLAVRMGVVAADNAAGVEARDDRTVVPAGVHTHPQVATVGLSEQQARAETDSVRVAKFPLAASGLAQAHGQTEGMTKIVACQETGRILGAVVIAPNATDLIAELALAMRAGLTVEQVAGTIHPHPTFSETIHEAAESWLGLPLHSLR
jgi:dihydrolipoamide dehydrogenase